LNHNILTSINTAMKTVWIILTIILLSVASFGQDEKYLKVMLATIEKMENASDHDEMLECINQFERIASAEKTLWLPYYYGAYGLIIMSFEEPDGTTKDQILDRAQENLDRALTIFPDESELYALQAFLYPSWVTADPMGRGMQYMEKMGKALEKAKAFSPDNPRALFLEAVHILNLPTSMGGGPGAARPIFLEADAKFRAFHNEDPLWPDWGEETNRAELEKLQ
jgi:hypothetical protein